MDPEQKPRGWTEQAIPPAVSGGEPAADGGPSLARKLGLFDITMLVMGSVIGAGIFAVPHTVAELVPSPVLVLAAWALGGLVTMAGSLVYAELTRRRPHVGGQYAYLREAYHPAVAFVYGWSLLWIIQSGGIAAVAMVFGEYCLRLARVFGLWLARWDSFTGLAASLDALPEQSNAEAVVVVWIAVAAVALVTAINCLGVRTGSTAQNVFMTLKILAIVLLVLCGLLLAGGPGPAGEPGPAATEKRVPDGWPLLLAFGAALVQVLFAYGGSHTTTFMGAEVSDPRRNLPRGLVLGIAGVVALYLAVNFVCLRVLGAERLAVTKSPAAEVMGRALGPPGVALISVGIVLSSLGFLSQATLTSPRVYYAMARDGLFFRAVARIHPRSKVPVVAILLQGVVAVAVIVTQGSFRKILDYVMVVEMTFLSLTALSLFVIRRRDASLADSGRHAVPGHPVTTLLFAAVMAALVVNSAIKDPRSSAWVFGLALTALPVYGLWRVGAARSVSPRSPAGRG